jgi:hypothetical protein
MIVWGYKHPIVVNIEISEGEFPKHIAFTDFSAERNSALKFESDSHEKVVVKLVKNLFNHKVPSGYELINGSKEFDVGGIHFSQTEELKGVLYSADSYVIENRSDAAVKLYEEMIYNERIYAVAFENDHLEPEEKTRLFIVRASEQ